jgi:histidinol-phosphatase
MLLGGRAEAWIESGVKIWDIAALKILVEEAGGTFTDFGGRRTVEAGECVASNGHVHAHVLAGLRA